MLACGLTSIFGGGCSRASNPGNRESPDAGADVGTVDDSCQRIRECVWYCSTDIAEPCVQNCVARGTASAQEAYRALAACTLTYCPTGESYCGCQEHCLLDGHCLAETAACAAGATDVVCESLCH